MHDRSLIQTTLSIPRSGSRRLKVMWILTTLNFCMSTLILNLNQIPNFFCVTSVSTCGNHYSLLIDCCPVCIWGLWCQIFFKGEWKNYLRSTLMSISIISFMINHYCLNMFPKVFFIILHVSIFSLPFLWNKSLTL